MLLLAIIDSAAKGGISLVSRCHDGRWVMMREGSLWERGHDERGS